MVLGYLCEPRRPDDGVADCEVSAWEDHRGRRYGQGREISRGIPWSAVGNGLKQGEDF